MRSTCALYIDAGYLLAAAATRVTGTSLRSGIHVEYVKLISSLIDTAQELSGLPLLRVHWYDSARNGVPDARQERIGEIPRVKLRLGRFGMDGEQKGVDLRIGLDLVTHARNDASDVFFVLSGDDDLTEAVEESQVHGILVSLLAVPNLEGRPHGVSRHLIRAADDIHTVDGAAIDNAVVKIEQPPVPCVDEPLPAAAAVPPAPTPKPGPKPGRPATKTPLDVAAAVRQAPEPGPEPREILAYSSSTGSAGHVMPGYDAELSDEVVDGVVARVLSSFRESATPETMATLERDKPSIPRDIDRAMLLDASDALGMYDLDDGVRYRLRARFWEMYSDS
ncbi:NYN domain-containing protein [Gordonia sp. (in: high G+C Gram-positive bacteria)]|uniref:NYN domain-containing protein n=1 Tax=Gordonia sp. (in: high G+C Gram-positive bacteria) TaxID=84139 RepID=UPI003F9CEC11